MSKQGAKFPHRLTWEWTKNRYHYCLPLKLAFKSFASVSGYLRTILSSWILPRVKKWTLKMQLHPLLPCHNSQHEKGNLPWHIGAKADDKWVWQLDLSSSLYICRLSPLNFTRNNRSIWENTHRRKVSFTLMMSRINDFSYFFFPFPPVSLRDHLCFAITFWTSSMSLLNTPWNVQGKKSVKIRALYM